MCNWEKQKDKFRTWAFRSPESQFFKFLSINPTHPFERRAPGVYVFTHRKSKNIKSAIWILLFCIAYFAYIGTEVASTFTQIDQLFFPCVGILISFHLIWLNLWPLTVVLNYPRFRYEYYVGEQIISLGPIVDAYIRLKILFAGEEDMFYQIVIGAADMPETEFTVLSKNGDLYRKVAKRLARTLHLNYFDVMDLSHLHECRHVTSRHLETLLGRETGMLNVIEKDIRRDFLTRSVDPFRPKEMKNPLELTEDLDERPNWPFVKVEELNLGVPLDDVRRLRAEKRARETFSWIFEQIPVKFRGLLRDVRISLIGRSHKDDPVPSATNPPLNADHEEELDEALKEQLIAKLEEAERGACARRSARWLLKFRTGKFEHRTTLSVEDRSMMRLVARYMALRTLVQQSGQEVPGLSKDLEFMGLYTSHADYSGFYESEISKLNPRWRRMAFGGGRKRQVHPSGSLAHKNPA